MESHATVQWLLAHWDWAHTPRISLHARRQWLLRRVSAALSASPHGVWGEGAQHPKTVRAWMRHRDGHSVRRASDGRMQALSCRYQVCQAQNYSVLGGTPLNPLQTSALHGGPIRGLWRAKRIFVYEHSFASSTRAPPCGSTLRRKAPPPVSKPLPPSACAYQGTYCPQCTPPASAGTSASHRPPALLATHAPTVQTPPGCHSPFPSLLHQPFPPSVPPLHFSQRPLSSPTNQQTLLFFSLLLLRLTLLLQNALQFSLAKKTPISSTRPHWLPPFPPSFAAASPPLLAPRAAAI